MEDKFNAASLPPPSTSSASDKPRNNNDESSLMDIGNWFMSLSRRRKSFSNKENNQNVSSTLVTETSQTNHSNNSFANNSCSSSANGSSGETGSGLSCTTKKITSSKNTNNNILYVLGKCLKLKFRAKQQNDLMSLTSTVASRRGIAASAPAVSSAVDRCASNGILNTDSMIQQQNMAISNAYVECPSSLVPTTTVDLAIASSTLPSSTTQATHSLNISAENCTTHVRSNFNELTDTERESNPCNIISSIEQAMHAEKLSMNAYGWYRGSLSRCLAQKKLQGQPNGSFLIRDSQTKGCNFTLSFRSAGITLHYRIENTDGDWIIEGFRFKTMVDLIEHARHLSRDQILCYVKPSSQLQQPFLVRLTNPISKFDEVPSLQHICRYVIRRSNDSDRLLKCLPSKLQTFVTQNAYLGKKVGYFEI